MKVGLRVLRAFASLFIAYFAATYVASFTGIPLVGGGKEATPLTEVVLLTVFPLSLILILVIGNLLINRYFRAGSSR
jgi:formate/nitrite transporter FocA (FNT family)